MRVRNITIISGYSTEAPNPHNPRDPEQVASWIQWVDQHRKCVLLHGKWSDASAMRWAARHGYHRPEITRDTMAYYL